MPNAKLKINEFGQEPLEIEIKSGLITLGRAPDNAVALVSDSNVSRYHAEIERRGDNFYLVDLNSRNGTFVNDEPVEGEHRLQEGDKIKIFSVPDALKTAETLLLATNSLLPYSLNTKELGERSEIEERVRRLADLLLTGLLHR